MIRNIAKWIRHVLLFNIRGIFITLFPGNNEKKIVALKNSARRDRCFIVATGPSLTISDVERLSNEVTFGLNSIFLIYDKTSWRPTHYVCADDGYFAKMLNEYKFNVLDFSENEIFLNKNNMNLVGTNERVRYLRFSRWNRSVDFRWTKFNSDIDKGMYAFGTVTNIAIAIAMYMGYKEVYLIGCDCSNLNKHVVNDVSDAEKSDEKAAEIAAIQIKGYRNMRRIAEDNCIKIYNSTRGGALEEFERVDFDTLFE